MTTKAIYKLLGIIMLCAGSFACLPTPTPPVLTQGYHAPTSFSIGIYHACAVLPSIYHPSWQPWNTDIVDKKYAVGRLYCWGDDPNADNLLVVPTDLADQSTDVISIAASYRYTCATYRLFDSGVFGDIQSTCWGGGALPLSPLPALTSPTQFVAGAAHICAIDSNDVSCWIGYNDPTLTAANNYYGVLNPPAMSNPTTLASGFFHSCAIDAGEVKCWGAEGLPPQYSVGQTNVPDGIINPKAISAGYLHTCVLDNAGINCWGDVNRQVALTNPVALASSSTRDCAIDASGLKCWGNEDTNTTPIFNKPSAVYMGLYYACAVDSAGVTCWMSAAGSNYYGIVTKMPPELRAANVVYGVN